MSVTMVHWELTLLVAVCLVVGLDLLIHLFYAWLALPRFEDQPPFRVTPPPADGEPPEPFEIQTSRDLRLRGGVYFPSDADPVGVILFCPETDGVYQTALNYTSALLDAGFAVVSFDFRNQGGSDTLPGYRATHWLTEYEVADVQAALGFIESLPQFEGLPVGLFGVSRGGNAALAAAAARREVRYVVAEGAFSTHLLALHYSLRWIRFFVGGWSRLIPQWHLQATLWLMLQFAQVRNGGRFVRLETLLPRLKDRNLLLISGGRDSYVPRSVPQRLCRLSGHSPEESHWVVENAKHNMERQSAREEFDEKVVRFFEQMVPPRPRAHRLESMLESSSHGHG